MLLKRKKNSQTRLILIVSLLTTQLSALPNQEKKPASFIKKMVVGLPTIWLSHYVLEFVSTLTHEMGHAITGKLFTGDPIGITIQPNPFASFICQPFIGCAWFQNKNITTAKELLRTAAGPLAGISATYAQLIMLEMLKGHLHNKPIKKSFEKGTKHPYRFLSKLTKDSETFFRNTLTQNRKEKVSSSDLASFILNGIMWFRSARIIGETLYGFTPMRTSFGNGDGERVWDIICNKTFGVSAPRMPGKLLFFTAIPMLAPFAIGFFKALKKATTAQKDKTKT